MEELFELFNQVLEEKGLIAEKGIIVDASFKEVPVQRNSKEENARIKNGEKMEEWSEDKRRQKDTDARWTKKNKRSYFGYKNHIKVDARSKLIKKYRVSSADVHNSKEFEGLLDETDEEQQIYADSAYRSEEMEEMLKSKVHHRAYRNKPLSDEENASNKEKSKVRVRVEHVFGFMKTTIKVDKLRTIGKERIEGIIGLLNLSYNICRYVYLRQSLG